MLRTVCFCDSFYRSETILFVRHGRLRKQSSYRESEKATEKYYSSDHIRYHLNFSAEYHKERLRKLVDSGEIVSYLDNLYAKVSAAIERQVEKWLDNDEEYHAALAVGDLQKANGLANMVRLCARERVLEAMIYV